MRKKEIRRANLELKWIYVTKPNKFENSHIE